MSYCGLHLPPAILQARNPDVRLKAIHKLVLGAIIQLHEAGGCWASYQHFSAWLGEEKRTIGDTFRALETWGFIVRDGRRVIPKDTVSVSSDTKSVLKDTKNRKGTKSVPPDTENVPTDTKSVPPDTENVPRSELEDNKKKTRRKGDARAEHAPPGESDSERDLLFDAIASVLRLDPSLHGNGGKIGAVKKALLATATPYTVLEVKQFGRLYEFLHPQKRVCHWRDMAEQMGLVRDPSLMLELRRHESKRGICHDYEELVEESLVYGVAAAPVGDEAGGEEAVSNIQLRTLSWRDSALQIDQEEQERIEALRLSEQERLKRQRDEAEALARENAAELAKEVSAWPEEKRRMLLSAYRRERRRFGPIRTGLETRCEHKAAALRAAMRVVMPRKPTKRR